MSQAIISRVKSRSHTVSLRGLPPAIYSLAVAPRPQEPWKLPLPLRNAILAVLLVLSPTTSIANDTMAELEAGGLVFQKSELISMEREDLTITAGMIRVRYEMRNNSPSIISGKVAFPLPELDRFMEMAVFLDNYPKFDQTNFLAFKVWSNGNEVRPTIQVQAVKDGNDVTQELRAAGIDLLAQTGPPYSFSSNTISQTTLARLIAGRFIEYDPHNSEQVFPNWNIRTAFHWDQKFEPGITILEHTYIPVLGGFFLMTGPTIDGDIDRVKAEYCVDRKTEAGIRNMVRKSPNISWEFRTLHYITTTAKNWAGPIGMFHLTLQGGANDKILSLCTDFQLKQTGPLQFEGLKRNYVPSHDIGVLFLRADQVNGQ